MLDVLEVYERPYDPDNPVLCIDEKNHQLIKDIHPATITRQGIYKQDSEYKRNGSVKEFVCIEPRTGKTYIRVVDVRSGRAFAKFLSYILSTHYPNAKQITLITDQFNIHTQKSITDTYISEYAQKLIKRIDWHYTPKHGSWLDQAEIAIHAFSQAVLKKRISTKEVLVKQVRAYQKRVNSHPKPINWQFTQKKAKTKFRLT